MENSTPTSASSWKARIDACKSRRRELVRAWSENVDYRRGKPFEQESDEDRVNVNLSWSLTKAKHAQLFSTTPNVVFTTDRQEVFADVLALGKRVNKRLKDANVGAAVDEAVFDVINASGIAGVMVAYEATTEAVPVSPADGIVASMMQSIGLTPPAPMPTERVVSARYVVERFSPSDLLWDVPFVGSDFDQSPWLGRSNKKYWAEAQREFKLKDEDRRRICGRDTASESLRDPVTNVTQQTDDIVEYDEIFYWRYRFDPAEKYHKAIYRIVFVHGLPDPVVDEPWKGQKFDEQAGQYVGACRLPIQVLTLTYVSDDPIPPSDTAIGRPQENELIESRTQLLKQRKRSIPATWHDVNRIDPLTSSNLMRGEWQASIPVQGNGATAIGEVPRAHYPQEDLGIDGIAKKDLAEQWSLGSNQLGQFASGERSATEAAVIQRSNDSRIGYERSRVANFLCRIAEVMTGLVILFDDTVSPALKSLPTDELDITIRPDSTVLLDAPTRFQQLSQFLNLTLKLGLYDPSPIVAEMAALASVSTELKPPPEQGPEPANVSVRAAEDLRDPIFLGLLMKTQQAPDPEHIEAAKAAIAAAGPIALPALVDEPTGTGAPAMPNPADLGPGLERITKRVDEQ